MGQAPVTLEGWYVLHDYRQIDWAGWKSNGTEERKQMISELQEVNQRFDSINGTRKGSYGFFAVAGHKADFLFLHMRPTLEELYELKNELSKTRVGDVLISTYSYVSIVELGGYLAKPGVDIETDEHLQSRLKPELPAWSHICFYPMNKRREGNDNWYMMSSEERRAMLKDHGMIGHTYADKVKQIVTGSVGLDDWEWGVTLFSDDPLQFKKLIYEMRFDESSARFAEFGPFLVGHRMSHTELARTLTL